MSFPYVYKTFEKDSLTDGSEWEEEWLTDADYVIEKIFVMRKDGSAFTASTITLLVENNPMTKDVMPCALLPPSELESPTLNIEIKRHQKFQWALKNNEGTTISVFLVLKLKKK